MDVLGPSPAGLTFFDGLPKLILLRENVGVSWPVTGLVTMNGSRELCPKRLVEAGVSFAIVS